MGEQNKVLVLGTGVSGTDVASTLAKNGQIVYVYDDNIQEEDNLPERLKGLEINFIPTINDILMTQYKYVVKSPGIKPDNEVVRLLKQANYEILSDLEIAYIFRNTDRIIAITGTNGKTSTTTLVDEVLKAQGMNSSAVGNIGVGVVNAMVNAEPEDVLVVEASSFQLDNLVSFKPHISMITNITSDHIDYHKTLDNYIEAKYKIFSNQDEGDYLVLNYDDPHLIEIEDVSANIIYCSIEEELDRGIYLKDGVIVYSDGQSVRDLIHIDRVQLLGEHNVYNIMFTVAAGIILNLDLELLAETIYSFKGLEHRLEYVATIDGVKYYNDSKGTNPDSTKKAIDAIKSNIVIILGGYDKKTDFTELLESSKDAIKTIVTLGETKYKIYNKALELGYSDVLVAESLEEAVEKCREAAISGDTVLLSPASASWDMFKSYEVRGREFKELVRALEGN